MRSENESRQWVSGGVLAEGVFENSSCRGAGQLPLPELPLPATQNQPPERGRGGGGG